VRKIPDSRGRPVNELLDVPPMTMPKSIPPGTDFPTGKRYWRGLEELFELQSQGADATPLVEEWMRREFPDHAAEWTDPLTRRQFLLLMGASLALAGVSGCSVQPAPAKKILPYVRQPSGVVPGRALYFATAMTLGGYATGLLVESHEGRPTKVEGNPEHPSSPKPSDSPARARFGATDVFAQAAVLTLYDPDRSRTVTHLGNIAAWESFVAALRSAAGSANEAAARRVRLRILTETVTSPTLAWQLRLLLQRYPAAKWHVYEPVGGENVRAGARLAFGAEK